VVLRGATGGGGRHAMVRCRVPCDVSRNVSRAAHRAYFTAAHNVKYVYNGFRQQEVSDERYDVSQKCDDEVLQRALVMTVMQCIATRCTTYKLFMHYMQRNHAIAAVQMFQRCIVIQKCFVK
jgi:hypothetical protein